MKNFLSHGLAVLLVALTATPATAQYRFIIDDIPSDPAALADGFYVIRATTAGETGYIYNAGTTSGENFRVSNVSQSDFLENPAASVRYLWELKHTGDEGTFTLTNLATGNVLPADNSRNLNCTQNPAEAALLQTNNDGTLWQTNYDYHGDILYLHTNYRSDDRCLSYWNELGTPGTGTALVVEFYACDVEEVFDVRVGSGTFYRQNRYSESVETSNSVYKYISEGSSPRLTITADGPTNNINVPAFDWYSGNSLSQNYTLSISDGYHITGYDITFSNGDASVPMTLTPAEGGPAITATGEEAAYASAADLRTQTTSFTISAEAHKAAHITEFLVYYERPHTATFRLFDGNSVVMEAEAPYFEGDALQLPDAFTQLPYARLTWDAATLMGGEDMNVRVDYAWDGPFQITTPDGAPRYFVCIGDSLDANGNADTWNPLAFLDTNTYDGNRFVLGECGYNGCESGLAHARNLQNDAGLWTFEGNVWDGFCIRAINGRLLAATTAQPGSDTGKSVTLRLVGESEAEELQTRWDVLPATEQGIADGFFLQQHGTSYCLNERQDGTHFFIAFWTGGVSRGSVFRVSHTLPEREALRIAGTDYSTSYYPFATQIPAGADLAAYTMTLSADGKSADLHEVANGLIPAGEPVLLAGTENVALELASADAPRADDNLLIGTADTIAVDAESRQDYLVLSWLLRPGFFVSNALEAILPHTAFIDNTILSSTRGLPLGAITGIASLNISTSGNANAAYDLQGRRVAKPGRGVYIIGGKKVIRK
ncbi:MAG: hypothetical protein IJS89_01600 [Bacteroidaceae bacterium]|nr:hypothetical protein [Bacteroidaceae bacterium]